MSDLSIFGLKGQHKSAQGKAKIDKVERSDALGYSTKAKIFKALKVRNKKTKASSKSTRPSFSRIVRPRDARRGRLSNWILTMNALTWGSVVVASLRRLTPGYGENSPSGNFIA